MEPRRCLGADREVPRTPHGCFVVLLRRETETRTVLVGWFLRVPNADGHRTTTDGLVELEDSTTMAGTTFTTPFAEKPVDGGEDHNVWIYYPITAGGGGVKKVLREKGSKSSDLYPDHPGNVRRTRPSCTTRGSRRPEEEVFQFGEELAV